MDLASHTWEMKPEQIIEMIQATCRSSKDIFLQKKAKAELTNDQIIKMLKTPKSNVTRYDRLHLRSDQILRNKIFQENSFISTSSVQIVSAAS